jgi:hypothetical protein
VQRGPATRRLSLSLFPVLVFCAVYFSGCEDPPPTRAELDAMSAIQRVHGHVLTDEQGHVTRIDFRGVQVRDDELAPLSRFPYLERLVLDDSSIGNAGLAHLEGLKNLKELSLRGTNVTDEGLPHLQKVPALREMDLERLPITDAGLIQLGPIKSLRKVYVGPGGPTSAGVDALKAQNPSVSVFRK